MDKTNRLGNEKISKLLLSFSIPAITGMLVNALYNIVDGLFVGNAVGSMGLAATAVARPLMNLLFAFSMLFGVGTSALISIKMGEGKREEAQHILSNGFFMMSTVGIVISVVGYIFIKPILAVLSASDPYTMEYFALPYARIIIAGTAFQIIGFGMNHSIRAQGHPLGAMYTMLVGAIANTILDAWFVWGLGMGVQGAAIATVISQAISMVWVMHYFVSRKSNIKLSIRIRPDWKAILRIMAIGSSAFLLQVASSLVMSIYNSGLTVYGKFLFLGENLGKTTAELEKMGTDIALAAFSIINSLSMLVLMPVFGINQGAQPIMGFNYGAKKFDRVRKTYWYAAGVATIWVAICFAAVMIFPSQLVSIFSKKDENYQYLIQYGVLGIRIVMMTLPILGLQIVSTSYFQAVGKPKKAMVVSLSRQFLILAPLAYLLPKVFAQYFGNEQAFKGLLWATPISDVLAFFITAFMVVNEMRMLKKQSGEERQNSKESTKF